MNVDWARWAIERGWHVFPIWGIGPDGCECGAPACGSAGKHPIGGLVPHGLDDATADVAQVLEWWGRHPSANVGINCGRSGLVVIDVDPRHGGDRTLDDWERFTPTPLPATLRVRTGGGGEHRYYRVPAGVEVPSVVGWLDGVDVKSRGGYVVGPGSLHASGAWYAPEGPETPVADLPDEFVEAELSARSRASRGRSRERVDLEGLLDGVPEGKRNETLFQAAYEMRWVHHFDETHAVTVAVAAARACTPPFPEAEARNLVARVYSYEDRDSLENVLLFPGAQQWAQGLADTGAADEDPDDAGPLPNGVHPFTDMGNALRLLDTHAEDLRFVPEWERWLIWDGTRWKHDNRLGALEFAKDVSAKLYLEEPHVPRRQRADFRRWLQTSQNIGRLNAMLNTAAADPRVVAVADDFDADDWVLNTASGILDLRTGQVHDHSRTSAVTKVARVAFVPGAEAPRWESFLERIVPQPDDRAFLQRAVGYSLTGDTSAKAMFILWGGGDNGKTVFLEVVRRVLGDYSRTAAKSVFVNRREGQHETDLAALQGRRFVTCGEEVNPGEKLNSGFLKSLTGGEQVTARFMRQDHFDFIPRCKLWLGTNHKPGLSDFGEALRRRLKFIPFTVTIPRHEQREREPFIEELVTEDGPGILWWALRGLWWYLQDGLGETIDMAAAKEQWYEDEKPPVDQFLEECVAADDEVFTLLSDIYTQYIAWCAHEHVQPLSRVGFGRGLASHLTAVKQAGKRGYLCRLVNPVRTDWTVGP